MHTTENLCFKLDYNFIGKVKTLPAFIQSLFVPYL